MKERKKGRREERKQEKSEGGSEDVDGEEIKEGRKTK
jgi:hypothetical protein